MKKRLISRCMIVGCIFLIILSGMVIAKVTTVKMWTPHDFDIRFGENYHEALFGPFEKENPDIKIEWVRVAQWEQKFRIAAAAGQLPNIFAVDGVNIPAYAARGILAPLDDFIPREVLEDYQKGCYDEMVWKGKTYGVGLETNTSILTYVPDLFEKAGLPATPPRYWDEIITIGQKLTRDLNNDGKIDQWGYDIYMGVGRGEGAMWDQTNFIYQKGGEIIDPETNRAVCNEPKALEAAQWIWDIYNKYEIAAKPGQVPIPSGMEKLATGRIAMTFDNSAFLLWRAQMGLKLEFKCALHPWPRDGEHVTSCGGWLFSMWKKTKDEAATVKVMNYLTSPHMIKLLGDSYGVPMRKSLVAELFPRASEAPWDIVMEEMKYTKPRPRSPDYPIITDAIQEAFDRAIFGEVSIKEAFDRAAQRIDEVIAK